jgi:hypothetical protein
MGWCQCKLWSMGAKVKFGIEKLGAVCLYPCLNKLVVVCCVFPKVGAEPSLVVQL